MSPNLSTGNLTFRSLAPSLRNRRTIALHLRDAMSNSTKTPGFADLRNAAPGRQPFLTPTAVAHAAFIPTGIVTVLLGPVLPSLSARWALTDAQAGELFTAQFLASTIGVASSGALVPRLGYKVVIVLGLIFMAIGVGALPIGSRLMGTAAVACYGVGLGLTSPPAIFWLRR